MAVKSCLKRLRAVSESRGGRVSRLRSRTPAGRRCSVNGVPVARVIASDDAVVAVEVAGLECGGEGRAVQLDVVTRREQVLDVAVLDAVAERICEKEPFRGEQALVGERLELGGWERALASGNR
ncbi:hypothetical protein [Streptomyces sp. NPDC059616]|uniref:hypothetical protein n=1 Tax=Streptomyces sp. NPDC059616 TaxID=3346886 RepID=UPI0036CF3728